MTTKQLPVGFPEVQAAIYGTNLQQLFEEEWHASRGTREDSA